MAKWICEYIPQDIETYVEVFGGAFWVYIKGDIHEGSKLKEIVYNDKNRFMVNLMQCCTEPVVFYNHIKDVKSLKKYKRCFAIRTWKSINLLSKTVDFVKNNKFF